MNNSTSVSFKVLFFSIILSGCSQDLIPNVTFQQVKPVFQHRCATCHSWTNYNKAYSSRLAILKKVWYDRTMPPNYMSEEERNLVRSWVKEGAKN